MRSVPRVFLNERIPYRTVSAVARTVKSMRGGTTIDLVSSSERHSFKSNRRLVSVAEPRKSSFPSTKPRTFSSDPVIPMSLEPARPRKDVSCACCGESVSFASSMVSGCCRSAALSTS
jgi:hypothetical protein